ncbi:hypothetical protein [Burkholderia gladioli]|uniref:hypothetical protein n=1 Tax=Burkholderia gladioli TaxID=28095 RepID=UPI001640DD5C|nr:hypothetical protein [Burkholderia gladioli]
MNERPICPWCRGPVLRSSRRCWVCIPCATLNENVKRTGQALPWAGTPLLTRVETGEATAPGMWPRSEDDMAHHLHRRGARVAVALEHLLNEDTSHHTLNGTNEDIHQRRIAALLALQQEELRAVADEALAIPQDEAPAAPARAARRRL